MSAIARSIEIHMPHAPQAVKMRILASMLTEAAKYDYVPANALPGATVVEPAMHVPANTLPAAVIEPAKPAALPIASEHIAVPPPAIPLEDSSDPTGVYDNLPMPGVVAEQGNHRYTGYTGKAGGPFRPGSTAS